MEDEFDPVRAEEYRIKLQLRELARRKKQRDSAERAHKKYEERKEMLRQQRIERRADRHQFAKYQKKAREYRKRRYANLPKNCKCGATPKRWVDAHKYTTSEQLEKIKFKLTHNRFCCYGCWKKIKRGL